MTSEQEWVNAGQAAGGHRVRHAAGFDEEITPHNELFRTAAAVGPGDHVLDIGCGTGQSTREAARAAASGSALGVDLSAEALALARQLSAGEGLRNVAFEQADAQVCQFPTKRFDLAISRFGVMFFADPMAAFANIRAAVRPGGRLVLLVWQDHERNEWSTAVRQALAAGAPVTDGAASGPDPFSLGSTALTQGILTAAGFTDIGFTEVHEPVYYGPDQGNALDFVLGLRDPADILARLDPQSADQARDRLATVIAEHDTGNGIYFDSSAWIISARVSQ
jgi:ubiquinone/menaquinone biosynthesis C-methylase UbiE